MIAYLLRKVKGDLCRINLVVFPRNYKAQGKPVLDQKVRKEMRNTNQIYSPSKN